MPRPSDPLLTDEITGLSNEWHFQILFDFAFAAGDRGIPLTLVLFEIDGFEEFRQREGSEAGADVLRHFASALEGTSREMDVTARLYGGRFLSLLRNCNQQGGLVFVDRVRNRARRLEDRHGLPISVGVATYHEDMSRPGDLTAAAHRALDRSRREGPGAVHTARDR